MMLNNIPFLERLFGEPLRRVQRWYRSRVWRNVLWRNRLRRIQLRQANNTSMTDYEFLMQNQMITNFGINSFDDAYFAYLVREGLMY